MLQVGDVNEQLEVVAAQLSGVDELRHGFDALGFSQGKSRHLLIKLQLAYGCFKVVSSYEPMLNATITHPSTTW